MRNDSKSLICSALENRLGTNHDMAMLNQAIKLEVLGRIDSACISGNASIYVGSLVEMLY
jgi:hypothetical protein